MTTAYADDPNGMSGMPAPEELADIELDTQADEQAARALLVPEGSYQTVPPATVVARKSEDGRTFVRVSAKIEDPEKGVSDRISFTFSPEVRIEPRTNKPDSASKRYLQLKAAVKRATGEEVTRLSQIKTFVESFPIRLRVGQFKGEDGEVRNVIYTISAVTV